MIKDLFENELVRGDLIVVSFSNSLYFAVFAKEGSAGNINYILVNAPTIGAILRGGRVYSSYVNTNYSRRFVKVDPSVLDKEDLEYAQIIINYLKTH